MLDTARVLFLAFLNICLFRKKPQDIPQSAGLLKLCLATYAVSASALLMISESFSRAVLSALVEIIIMLVFILLLLKVMGKYHRWIQTITALSGTGVVLSLIALPIYVLMGFFVADQGSHDPVYSVLLLLLACLAIWNISVMAHILRHALETGVFTSVMLSITYVWIILVVSTNLFPTELS